MKVYTTWSTDYTLFWATVIRAMGHEYLYLGPPDRDVVDLAQKHSQESWCYDLKLVLGDLIRGAQNGADVIIGPGGDNNCILGHASAKIYPDIIEEVVGHRPKYMSYNLSPEGNLMAGSAAKKVPEHLVPIKAAVGMGTSYWEVAELKRITKTDVSWEEILPAVKLGVDKMKKYTDIKQKMFALAPYLDRPELARRDFSRAHKKWITTDTIEDTQKVYDDTIASMESHPRHNVPGEILKVGICGDFYCTFMGQFPVFDLYGYLQDELGVEIVEPLTWYNFHFPDSPLLNPQYMVGTIQMLGRTAGGSDPVTVLIANYLKGQEVDGIAHLGVFACNPEVAAADVIHRYGKKHNFPPFLDIMFDEHTMPEAIQVRLEAFADMLRLNKGQSPLFDRGIKPEQAVSL